MKDKAVKKNLFEAVIPRAYKLRLHRKHIILYRANVCNRSKVALKLGKTLFFSNIYLCIFSLFGCAGNNIVLTYPESTTSETRQEILDRDIWVLTFGDQRKNSAVGLKRENVNPKEWIRITTDTPIAKLVTQGVRKELVEAGYRVVDSEKLNLVVTGEVRKFESHYIADEPPFVLAMAQFLVTVVAYDKEKDNMELIFQEEFMAGAQKEEVLFYGTDLFVDALTAALQRVCRKIAASKDLLASIRDYYGE